MGGKYDPNIQGGSPWNPGKATTERPRGQHRGKDFPAPAKTPIPAAEDGTLLCLDPHKDFGNVVIIRHDGAVVDDETPYSLYAHMNEPSPLCTGAKEVAVKKGDIIGSVGNTGQSRGNHLHFEIIKGYPLPIRKSRTTYDPDIFEFPDKPAEK